MNSLQRITIFYALLVLIAGSSSLDVIASGQFNWLRPYDTLLVPDQKLCSGFQLFTISEIGVARATGYNCSGNQVDVLQIWDSKQDALAMLNGFPPSSPIGKKNIELSAVDNGTRGNFIVNGDLELQFAVSINGRYFFWENFALGIYMPFYGVQLSNVTWNDLTQDITPDDVRVREDLTDNITTNIQQLGDGLWIKGWNRKGPGDLVMLLEFFSDFPQQRPMLSLVGVHGRIGLNFPTGVQQNEDLIFAVPFGYDGAMGFFGAGGIDLTYCDVAKVGLDVELLNLFGTTKTRRIKTFIDQTELALLGQVCAYKDPGLVQRFNLYGQLFNVFGGAALKVGYQFFKQGSSELAFSDSSFSSRIANSAQSLREWTMHHIIGSLSYDFSAHLDDDSRYKPYVSVFSRIPLAGKNIALIPTIGCVVSCTF